MQAMVDNIASFPSFTHIRSDDVGTVNFNGRGPLRLDAYGSMDRVGRTECVLQGSGQIALPGVPA